MTNQLSFAFEVVEPNSQALTAIDEVANRIGCADRGQSLVDDGAPSPTEPHQFGTAAISRVTALEPPQEAERPATLQDCLTWLEAQLGTNDPEVKAIRGALTTFLMVIHREPDRRKAAQLDLLARPSDLRGAFRSALPAAFRISRSRWSNMKSLLGSLLIATGWIDPAARSRGFVTPSYQALAAMKPKGGVNSSLLPFLRFCERRGTAPAAISLVDLSIYETWLVESTLDLHPQQTGRNVETAWRRLRRICHDWPQQELRTPSRRWQKALDISSFPASFGMDLHAFLNALRNPDPLDPDNGRPMAELSVQHVRRYLLRAATYLVQARTPITDVSSLSVLVTPAAFRAIAMQLHDEGKPGLIAAGEVVRWTHIAADIAAKLIMVARRWVKVPPKTLAELQALRKMIKPRRGGLSNRVQDRLADLTDEQDRAELFALPWRAFEVADRMLRDGDTRRAAKLHETALAMAIVLQQPMRHGNLASLDLVQHVVRDRRGRMREVVMTALRVKNRKTTVRFPVPDDLAARLKRHEEYFRPHIRGAKDSSFLFPSPGGSSRQPQSLGRHIKRLVEQQLGKRFNVHLARHLAVDLLLEEDPQNLVIAQRLLGHSRLKTTEEVYGSRQTLAANRHYTRLIRDAADREASAAVRRGRKRT